MFCYRQLCENYRRTWPCFWCKRQSRQYIRTTRLVWLPAFFDLSPVWPRRTSVHVSLGSVLFADLSLLIPSLQWFLVILVVNAMCCMLICICIHTVYVVYISFCIFIIFMMSAYSTFDVVMCTSFQHKPSVTQLGMSLPTACCASCHSSLTFAEISMR